MDYWCEDPEQITFSAIPTANIVHVVSTTHQESGTSANALLGLLYQDGYPYSLAERQYIPQWHTVGVRGYNRISRYPMSRRRDGPWNLSGRCVQKRFLLARIKLQFFCRTARRWYSLENMLACGCKVDSCSSRYGPVVDSVSTD